jgi:hypothetical protein
MSDVSLVCYLRSIARVNLMIVPLREEESAVGSGRIKCSKIEGVRFVYGRN